jgi:hypothetical protein
MPRKTTKKKEEASTEAKVKEPMVTIVKTAQAAKLSPRGDGLISYQLGKLGDALLVRISGNESSGRFSKEWVPVEKIRDALSKVPKGAESFKAALLLRGAWKGKSSCNGGFAAAIFVAENVFAREDDPKKKSMLKLSAPDALEVWEKKVLEVPVPEDAEVVPLHPPKAKPFFAKKKTDDEGEDEKTATPENDSEKEKEKEKEPSEEEE